MNWQVFFAVLIFLPLGIAGSFGLVAVALWLDRRLGDYWGGAICGAALLVALAALLGWVAP